MTLAHDVIRALAATEEERLPPEVEQAALLHFLDAIGVGLAAAATGQGRPYRRFVADRLGTQGDGAASIFVCRGGFDPAYAALINGGLIHSLEYDDTHTFSIVHGSAVLAPAALAAAQSTGAGFTRMLGAYARGWEFLIRLGVSAPGAFQAAGFQITSTGGALAAACISAELSGLDVDRRVAALGIALSLSSGVFEFLSNGSSVKSLHPGWAAHAGMNAAAFAHAGLTGPETLLEGTFGFFNSFARDSEAADHFRSEIATIGQTWRLTEAAFKFYPCCHYLHPFIEAAGLLADQGITADDVEHLVCLVPKGATAVICEPWESKCRPASGHAARWSLPYVVAQRLMTGSVDIDTFEQPVNPSVIDLARRMSWQPLANDNFPLRFEAELSCRVSGGAVRHVRVEDAFGNHSRPATPEAVRQKFRANARRSLTDEAVAAIEHALLEAGEADALPALARALRTSID